MACRLVCLVIFVMTNRAGFISCLVVALILPQLATPQKRVEGLRTTSRKIACTVRIQDREWKPDEPAIVSGVIENLTDGPQEVNVFPTLYLSSKSSSADRDKYWASVDLFGDRPLSDDRDKKGGISAQPIKLAFKAKNDLLDFHIDAKHILWEREISSIWPSRKLFVVVEPGSYDLRLIVEADDGYCACNAPVVVARNRSHPLKP